MNTFTHWLQLTTLNCEFDFITVLVINGVITDTRLCNRNLSKDFLVMKFVCFHANYFNPVDPDPLPTRF